MFWALQLGIEAGHAEEALREAIKDLGLPHICVKLIPFSHELEPNPPPIEGKVTCYGSTFLREAAQKHSWDPGFYYDEATFNFDAWREHWGTELLNYDSVVCRFEDIEKIADHIFLRPHVSEKIFTGCHVSWKEFVPWREEILSGSLDQRYMGLNADTLVACAPAKDIRQEARFFIVDCKIVTGSFYRLASTEHCNTVSSRVSFFDSPWYDADLERYVQERIEQWQPHRAFVLDVATTVEGFKIIEVNSVSSSGFYECDVRKIVEALEELEAE